jgi:predicted ester cyclase
MAQSDALAIVRQWVAEVWNAGRYERLKDFHPPVFDNHGRPTTVEEARQWHVQMRSTYPDLHYTIEDVFGCGERVALRWTATGTQRGDLWSIIPATNERVEWAGMHMLHVAEGRIDAVWAVADSVAILRQLGVTLQPRQA